MKRAQSELGLMLYNSDHPAFIAKNIKSQDDVNKISIRSTQKRRNFPQSTGKRRDNNRKVSDTDTMSYIMALRVDRFRAKRKTEKTPPTFRLTAEKTVHTPNHTQKNTKSATKTQKSTHDTALSSFHHCFVQNPRQTGNKLLSSIASGLLPRILPGSRKERPARYPKSHRRTVVVS